METARTKALKSLASSMPVANQRVAQGMQQARLMGMQQAVAGAPAPGSGTPAPQRAEIQQAGAAQATQAGDIVNKAAAQTQKQLAQVGELGAAETARAGAEAVGLASVDAQQAETADGASLASFGRDVKQQLFDLRVQFDRDEAGRKLMNESKLIDHAITSTKSEQEFKSRMQSAQLMHEKRTSLLKIAHQKVVAAMEYASKSETQELDQASREGLAVARANLEREMQRSAADAANKQAMWQAGGTIVGAGAGAAFGQPAAGAAIGGAVGSYAGTQAK